MQAWTAGYCLRPGGETQPFVGGGIHREVKATLVEEAAELAAISFRR
jgi:hypothetical protein